MYPLKFISVKNNPGLDGMAAWRRDIVYSTATGTELKMQVLIPWGRNDPASAEKRRPCIVFVQGSAWTFPDVGYELPQMSEFARKGYVVAMVTHRSALDGHKAPAFLEDVKTAIRFLRKNEAEYQVDAGRIGIWGTSSGGNTALLAGLTGDDPAYQTGEYAGYSDAVRTVVDCFGPADLAELTSGGIPEKEPDGSPSVFFRLLGDSRGEQMERIGRMNPVEKVVPGRKYPPFMLLHGDSDTVVPYSQSEKMARVLCQNDVPTELVRVEGAPHEGSFWSRELLALIEDFIGRTL